MEFRFDLNDIFQHPVVEIGNSLIPPGFSGDKRALWDTQSKITQIVNAVGEASAHAQGLSKPITTADRLRNSEHRLYLLVDQAANNGKGAVTGMLKTGEKGLYVFDRDGQHYQVSPPCVLDFYIHESRQRSGFGKQLFEHMLQKEQIEPVRMAVDRPSDKLLGFLNKHYGLNSPVKQMNNYVVYEGFFPRTTEPARSMDGDKSFTPSKNKSANGLQQGFSSSPYGRYAAQRPTCSMGQIIHNDSPVIKRNQEPTGVRSEPITNAQGQGNYFYGNPTAWQTTQSVPNMHHASLNQQNVNQNQPSYVANEPYSQDQRNYPHGDFQPVNYNPNNQSVLRNFTMAQGDAPSQMYGERNVVPAEPPRQNDQQNAYMPPASTVNQHPSQIANPQVQNYFYNPQSQQYQLPSTSTRQTLPYAGKQNYYRSETACQPLAKVKEPLVPQSFDGAVKKMPHTVQSVPEQETKHNSPVLLQNSTSAPVKYQQQPIQIHQQVQGQAYNRESTMTNANEGAGKVNETVSQTSAPVKYQQQPIQIHQQVQGQAYNRESTMTNANEGAGKVNETVSQIFVDNPTVQQALLPQYRATVPLNYQHPELSGYQQAVTQEQAYNQQVSQAQMATNEVDPQVAEQSPHHQYPASVHLNYQQPALDGYRQAARQDQIYSPAAPPQSPPTQQASQTQMTTSQVGSQMAGQISSQGLMMPQISNQNEASSQIQGQPSVQIIQQNSTGGQNITDSRPNTLQSQPYIPNFNEQYQPPHQVHSIPRVAATTSNTTMPPIHQDMTQNQYSVENSMQQLPSAAYQQQTINPNQPAKEGQFVPTVNRRYNMDTRERHINQPQEVDLSKGYPPQHHEHSAQNSTPKADRPNSLNIEPAEEMEPKMSVNIETETKYEEALDGHHEDVDSLDEDDVDAIEREIRKVEIAPKTSSPLSRDSKSPGIEAAGIVTPGRSTPGLTDQGYFDLKFYHNKLW